MDKYEYTFPIEDLDHLIDQLNQGIKPAVPDEMLFEARIRYKELQNELFDGDDEEVSAADIKRHNELLKQKIESDRRKAHKENIKIAKISEKQKAKLMEAVSTSLVRPTYSNYNKTDEERYGSETRMALYKKYSSLKSVYRNPYDYKTAIGIIQEVIKDSLDNDYPATPREQVYAAYQRGEIKINIQLPKLFSDYVHEIKDKEILKGILTGDVAIMTKSQMDDELVKQDYSKSELVEFEYDAISNDEYREMVSRHRRGEDTPIGLVLKNKGKIYSQFTMPSSNMFSIIPDSKRYDSNGIPITFDWMQDDADEKFIDLMTDRDPYDPQNLAALLNKNNNNDLSLEFRNSIISGNCVSSGTYETSGPMPGYDSIHKQKDDRTLALEQSILQAIQNSN